MIPVKNLPMLLNLTYYGYNRGVDGDFEPILDAYGNIIKTFCNEFVQSVCNGIGYGSFNNLVANDMVDFMQDPSNGWISVDDGVAQSHANAGILVIAGRRNVQGHGHVNLIIPGILEKSSSFGKAVPKCVNVGKDVFYGKRISFAFSHLELPTYFALAAMI